MITCEVEPFSQAIEEAQKTLLPLHWEMLALDKEVVQLNPNFPVYSELERTGRLVCFVLRENGKIVGYWSEVIDWGLHYKDCLTAIMDIFFIHPDYRTGANVLRLLRAVEKENRRRGVKRWFAGEKIHAPIGRLFTTFGFRHIENNYSKLLEV